MSHLEVFFTDFKRIRYVWSAARVPSLGFLVTRSTYSQTCTLSLPTT